jgi:serine/threonine protein kinase
MSSDESLPFANYHRASHVGTGSFGSVVIVYNDDGEEFALKLFANDDDEDDDDDSNPEAYKPLSLGALREISCLRLLRRQHDNIVSLVDIQAEWSDDEQGGAGTSGCLGMALPFYRDGSLGSAIDKKMFLPYPKKVKVEIAHSILSALVFLHDNGILHRDIKSDNILLESEPNERWKAILIDFSLAKPVSNVIWNGNGLNCVSNGIDWDDIEHTGEVGTMVYTAPEIMAQQSYGMPSDVYSVGVVLLELLLNQTFNAVKHKEAVSQINQAVNQLPVGVPFPNLVRSMLDHDPTQRPTARQAIEHPLFTEKFGLVVPPVKYVNVASILPYDLNTEEGENESPNVIINNGKKKNKVSENRIKLIDKVCNELESQHPITRHAAFEYSELLRQLNDDMDDTVPSQSLLDCVVLAHRFFELDLLDLNALARSGTGKFASWSLEDYVDNESTIFMLTDYCLYPRNVTLRK